MPLEPCQVQLVRAGRTLTLGPGTPYTVLPGWDPWSRNVRADQGGPRPHAHGSWVGTEWMEEAVVLLPVSIYRDGSTRAEWLAAHQELAAAFAAVGDSQEMCELHFEWGGTEYLMFGRPRQVRVEAENVAVGKSVEQCAFVCPDPRIYSAAESISSTGLPVQQGGLTVPARVATTRLSLPGTAGSYASTPDHASLDITGSIDIRADLTPHAWDALTQTVAAKWDATSADQQSWQVVISALGELTFGWTVDGDTTQTLTSTVPVPPGTGAVRVAFTADDGAGGHAAVFYTGESLAGPWTPLGATVAGSGTVVMFSGSAPVEVGSSTSGASNQLAGVVRALEVYDGVDGTLVAAPDFTAQAVGATSFADSTGKTWTVHGDAAIVGDTYTGGLTVPMTVKGVLVGGVLDLVNAGTAPSALQVRIDGPVVEPGLVLQGPDGTVQTLSFDLDLVVGQWLEIDTAARTALLNGLPGSNQRGVAAWDMNPYPLQPGTNHLRFSSAVYNGTAQMTADHRSAWW